VCWETILLDRQCPSGILKQLVIEQHLDYTTPTREEDEIRTWQPQDAFEKLFNLYIQPFIQLEEQIRQNIVRIEELQ